MLYSSQVIQNMLISHTNVHAVRGRPTLKGVDHFRNGLVRELKLNVNSNVDLNVNSAENRLAKHQVNSTKDEKTTLHQEEHRYEVKMKSIKKLTLLCILFIVIVKLLLKVVFLYIKESILYCYNVQRDNMTKCDSRPD
jgi:hypothetical protein